VNEDWMAELEARPGEELERTLDRYARLRLEPTVPEAKRARAAVMEAAWRQRIAGPDLVADHVPRAVSEATTGSVRRGPFAGWGPRRATVSLAAAVLAGLLVGSTAFAATRAGGPLYGVRLAVDQLTLPSDPTARLEAELALAQGRLADIVEAASRDDLPAVAAAVDGYLAAIATLDGVSGSHAERAEEAVASHRAVLLEVLDQVPEEARSGVENALASSGRVIDRLDAAGSTPGKPAAGSGGNGGADAGSGSQGGGTGSQGSGGSQGEKPSKEPTPAKSPGAGGTDEPKPTKPPKPTESPAERGGPGAPGQPGENTQGGQP
jgi:uncharacterized membrane protein YgcG